MKRRWLGIALILGMVMALTACSGQGQETSAPETTPVATEGVQDGETLPEQAQTEAAEETPGILELPEYNAADYVSLDQYTGMDVEVPDGLVTDEEFEDILQQLVESFATVEQITDRETKEGDTINFDYSGAIDGVVFDGGTAKSQTQTLGTGGFIDGFEEGLIGKPCGEEFVVDAYFPDNYGVDELNGKTAQFTMKINYIVGEQIIPELNDEFVKGLENYTCGTVEEFKTVYRAELDEQKTAYMTEQAKNMMWQSLIDQAVYSGYPEGYMEAYVEDMMASYTYQASIYGFSLEELVEGMYRMDIDTFNARVNEQAEMQIKSDILYHYIADREGITATEEDYLAMVQEYMEYYNYDDMTAFVNAYGVDNVERQGYADALLQKVIDFCYESANYVPYVPETESVEDPTAEDSTAEATTAAETTAAE